MNSGFLSFATKGKVSTIGTHQKFDRTAFRLLEPLVDTMIFPPRSKILKFEGIGGPDGLKVKGHHNTDHLWDPINEIGMLPTWVDIHCRNLATAIKNGDVVKASFEAGWMAHYVTDGLTPAHHISHRLIAAEYQDSSKLRRNWLYWGRKGLMSSHVAFETGISSSMLFSPIRTKFDPQLYKRVQEKGLGEVLREESLKIAKLDLYDQFLRKGWTIDVAKTIRSMVIPRIPQLIAAGWLLAYEQSGQKPKLAKQSLKTARK